MQKYNVIAEIKDLIYDHEIPEKFIYNHFTGKTQINPKMLYKTESYNTLKKMVYHTSNQRTGMVDVTLLDSFFKITQIKLKIFETC